jgi:hypothetical protein
MGITLYLARNQIYNHDYVEESFIEYKEKSKRKAKREKQVMTRYLHLIRAATRII